MQFKKCSFCDRIIVAKVEGIQVIAKCSCGGVAILHVKDWEKPEGKMTKIFGYGKLRKIWQRLK